MFSCEVHAQNEMKSCNVVCQGALGINASGDFEDRLPPVLLKMNLVEFEFSRVHQIDPDGAALLLQLVKQLIAKQVHVRIIGISPLPMISLMLLKIPEQIGPELFEN